MTKPASNTSERARDFGESRGDEATGAALCDRDTQAGGPVLLDHAARGFDQLVWEVGVGHRLGTSSFSAADRKALRLIGSGQLQCEQDRLRHRVRAQRSRECDHPIGRCAVPRPDMMRDLFADELPREIGHSVVGGETGQILTGRRLDRLARAGGIDRRLVPIAIGERLAFIRQERVRRQRRGTVFREPLDRVGQRDGRSACACRCGATQAGRAASACPALRAPAGRGSRSFHALGHPHGGHRLRRHALATAGEAEPLGGRRLHADATERNARAVRRPAHASPRDAARPWAPRR